ncbi:hypothetical protein VE23_19425 [Paenibacillus sp. D9]|nr:hypothetical protein VE23_19425 [Paenibacillus sp. D9]
MPAQRGLPASLDPPEKPAGAGSLKPGLERCFKRSGPFSAAAPALLLDRSEDLLPGQLRNRMERPLLFQGGKHVGNGTYKEDKAIPLPKEETIMSKADVDHMETETGAIKDEQRARQELERTEAHPNGGHPSGHEPQGIVEADSAVHPPAVKGTDGPVQQDEPQDDEEGDRRRVPSDLDRSSASDPRLPYFISITSKTIEHERSGTDQLEISATQEELEKLKILLDEMESTDDVSSLVAAIPYKSNDRSPTQKRYQSHVNDLYMTIHELGTAETRAFIEGTNLFRELNNTDFDLPGYDKEPKI